MSDNRDYYVNKGDNGTINISEDVVMSIASLAANEIEGIAGLYATAGVDIAELLGRKNLAKGVKIQMVGRNVTLDIFINIYYGRKIPEIAARLQESVISSVESMTGLTVDAVNVHVGSIVFEPKSEEN